MIARFQLVRHLVPGLLPATISQIPLLASRFAFLTRFAAFVFGFGLYANITSALRSSSTGVNEREIVEALTDTDGLPNVGLSDVAIKKSHVAQNNPALETSSPSPNIASMR